MRRKASPLLVQGIAQTIAIHLARNYAELVKEPRSGSSSLPGYKLRQVTEWMAEHMADDFNLEQLAAQAGLSKFHFHRLFKSAVGVPPSHYHINLRMDEAKRLLRDTKQRRSLAKSAERYTTLNLLSAAAYRKFFFFPGKWH